jgi:integrase
MPRRAAGLSALSVKTAGKGRHGDGGGLYLYVRSQDAKFWLFRYRLPGGKSRDAGLGPATGKAAITLANARLAAAAMRDKVRSGIDPLEEKKKAVKAKASEKTFKQVAELYANSHEAGWRNARHAEQWRQSLKLYAFPTIGDTSVAEIDTDAVLSVLSPIWERIPETASRVRGRIECVLDYASASGWRAGENPARWRGGLASLLPRSSKVRAAGHHKAVPWQQMPAVMAELRQRESLSALALRFVVLTAARSGEVRGMRWREVDVPTATWVVPASRMKAGQQHRVALSMEALAVLEAVRPLAAGPDALVFPGARPGRPLTDVALAAHLRPHNSTVHGCRSGFRQWVADTAQDGEAAEAALAHAAGGAVVRAYQRSDLLERRRPLMEAWAAFLTQEGQE